MKTVANTVLMNSPFQGLDPIREVYLIGIGGIGMSAIARFFHARGARVAGYDKTPTPLTREMEASGITIHYEEDVSLANENADLVIYTPAIPATHKELAYFRENRKKLIKRSDALQLISGATFNICIAGTHGKTTVTTMVAHLLRDTGFGCNAFLGGISVNYGTNFWSDPKNLCVIEADEYDRSFLKLNPDIAVITAMDADHLDIYGTADAVEQAFIDFSQRIRPGGILFHRFGLKRGKDLVGKFEGTDYTYSLQNNSADVYGENIRLENGGYDFDVVLKEERLEHIRLNMGGMHNVENAIAAIAVASSLGIEKDKIRSAVGSFSGVKRRFEYIIHNRKLVFVDDYAHHPEELRALINGARSLFRKRKCTIIFQPHLFTRTRDFADGFAEALDLADEVILLPVYPARELPINGVASEMILERIKNSNKRILDKQELLAWIGTAYKQGIDDEFGNLLITAGAGDIDTLLKPLKELLSGIN